MPATSHGLPKKFLEKWRDGDSTPYRGRDWARGSQKTPGGRTPCPHPNFQLLEEPPEFKGQIDNGEDGGPSRRATWGDERTHRTLTGLMGDEKDGRQGGSKTCMPSLFGPSSPPAAHALNSNDIPPRFASSTPISDEKMTNDKNLSPLVRQHLFHTAYHSPHSLPLRIFGYAQRYRGVRFICHSCMTSLIALLPAYE